VVRERSRRAPTATLPAPVDPASVSLGPPDEALEEVLASLTIKRRRFLRHYLATGNARQAVRAAGYNCTTPQSETSVAQEILEHPLVQHAQKALLHAEGLSWAGLRQIHAIHLARHSSPDGGDRSLRATALAYKYLRPPPVPAGTKPLLDQLLDEMTPEELRRFAASGLWPVRFAARLGHPGSADCTSSESSGPFGLVSKSHSRHVAFLMPRSDSRVCAAANNFPRRPAQASGSTFPPSKAADMRHPRRSIGENLQSQEADPTRCSTGSR
jgi:hypothetical protein